MGIADSLAEEALEYLRLEDFLTVLQFSLMDERSAENSFQVFSCFLDKGLTVRVAGIGYVGDGLRPHNSDIKVALHKVENDLFDTNAPKSRIYKQYNVTVPNWDNVPVGDLFIKRSDVHDLYRDAYHQTRFPWALTKWPSSENEWNWFPVIPKADSEKPQRTAKTIPKNGIDLTNLMQLLDCSSPQDCWLFDDCEIDENGIRAKPITRHIEGVLIGDEWQIRKQFERDIRLSLPCSLDDVKNWVERNGFDDVILDNLRLLKERQTSVARIKADRTMEANVSTEELLNKPIFTLLTDIGLDRVEEFERCFQLYVWQDVLNAELVRVNQAEYQFEENRKADKALIMSRLTELDCLLNGDSDCERVNHTTAKGQVIRQGKNRKRQDNLTKAIISAMASLRRKPSLDDLWQYFTDDRDTTGFIIDYTDEAIIWTDTKGNCHETRRKTLANRLSKLPYPD